MGNKNSNIHHSPMKITKKKFIWTIENFSAREEETEEFFKSGEFSSFSPSGNRLKWQLKIYPKGQNEAKDHVSIYIFLIESAIASSQISAKAEFCIRAKGKGLYREKKVTEYNKFTKNGNGWGFRKFIKRDLILNQTNCPNDLLTIVCKVYVRSEKIITDEDKGKFKIPACRMVKDIGNLFEKNQYTDCLIKADDGKEFMVHKCILAGRSPVFAVMFKNQLVDEVESDILKIDNIKSEVLEQLFRFIYSGEAPKMREMARDLLAAADKFELERLKMLCESHLVESLEKGNVCELLVLASCNSAEYLKTKAIEYIKLHGIKVKELNGWEMLAKEHLQLFE